MKLSAAHEVPQDVQDGNVCLEKRKNEIKMREREIDWTKKERNGTEESETGYYTL